MNQKTRKRKKTSKIEAVITQDPFKSFSFTVKKAGLSGEGYQDSLEATNELLEAFMTVLENQPNRGVSVASSTPSNVTFAVSLHKSKTKIITLIITDKSKTK